MEKIFCCATMVIPGPRKLYGRSYLPADDLAPSGFSLVSGHNESILFFRSSIPSKKWPSTYRLKLTIRCDNKQHAVESCCSLRSKYKKKACLPYFHVLLNTAKDQKQLFNSEQKKIGCVFCLLKSIQPFPTTLKSRKCCNIVHFSNSVLVLDNLNLHSHYFPF